MNRNAHPPGIHDKYYYELDYDDTTQWYDANRNVVWSYGRKLLPVNYKNKNKYDANAGRVAGAWARCKAARGTMYMDKWLANDYQPFVCRSPSGQLQDADNLHTGMCWWNPKTKSFECFPRQCPVDARTGQRPDRCVMKNPVTGGYSMHFTRNKKNFRDRYWTRAVPSRMSRLLRMVGLSRSRYGDEM